MARIYALNLVEPPNDDLFSFLTSKIDADKNEKIHAFLRKEDAARSLFSDLLIRYILMDKFGLANDSISFQYTSYGKPLLKNHGDIHFNLSHSGHWVVCATDRQPIGIDVENITPVDMDIAGYYFSDAEKRQLFSRSPAARLPFFFELWTLKESFIKQQGKGLSIPLSSFTISKNTAGRITLQPQAAATPLHFRQYEIDPLYKMAVCGLSDDFEEVEIISIHPLISHYQSMK